MCVHGLYICFFEKIYFHKTNLQKKSYIQYQTHYYKRKELKAKKRLEILKEGRKEMEEGGGGGSHYVIPTIERHNPFKLFSLYTFYAIDQMNNL